MEDSFAGCLVLIYAIQFLRSLLDAALADLSGLLRERLLVNGNLSFG